ncbi:hypothetical protein ACJX0J_039222 [Zea mays]
MSGSLWNCAIFKYRNISMILEKNHINFLHESNGDLLHLRIMGDGIFHQTIRLAFYSLEITDQNTTFLLMLLLTLVFVSSIPYASLVQYLDSTALYDQVTGDVTAMLS